MPVRDVTGLLKADGLAWSGVGKTLQDEFDDAIIGARDGLYVFVFSNESDKHVRDNNTRPKTVIRPASASLKAGKFEQGFARRLASYHDHLRREDGEEGVRHVFAHCLRLALVLDLSPLEIGLDSPGRVFERYWTESIDAFLDRRGLLAKEQNWRAEWRNLERPVLSDPERDELAAFVGGLAVRISKMAKVLSPNAGDAD